MSHKTCGLSIQVNYGEKCTFGGLKGQSLNTGGLKDRFDCTGRLFLHILRFIMLEVDCIEKKVFIYFHSRTLLGILEGFLVCQPRCGQPKCQASVQVAL